MLKIDYDYSNRVLMLFLTAFLAFLTKMIYYLESKVVFTV